MRPFVDFYRANNISPVAQDISDLKRHFARRAALYRHLGLVPGWIKGRKVVEFGPGSGHNALYTASLAPARYLLVDGNPAGLTEAEALLAASPAADRIETVEALIEDFDTPERFDLVLCEGTVPFQIEPGNFTRRLARFAAPGGVVVITCVDGVSMLAETLRRLIALLAVAPELTPRQKLAELLPIFTPHLKTLKGMSRSPEDWIYDQMLQPLVGRLFSIADAIDALAPEFTLQGTSPHFATDWRWYKDMHGAAPNASDVGRAAYFEQLHNFLDYRVAGPARAAATNRTLLANASRLFTLMQDVAAGADATALDGIGGILAEISADRDLAPETAAALGDFRAAFDHRQKTGRFGDFGCFAAWFGRGQQYASFIRDGARDPERC